MTNGLIIDGDAVKRVYVPDRHRAALVAEFADRAAALRVGDGMAAGTQLGPLNNAPQYARIHDLTAAALAQGAIPIALAQGAIPSPAAGRRTGMATSSLRPLWTMLATAWRSWTRSSSARCYR